MVKKRVIYWLPRILSLGFILFISLFALDVFDEAKGFAVVLPLLIHLIPSFILLLLLVIAWKYDWVGTFVFIIFSVWYGVQAGLVHLAWILLISGPSLLVGILFWLSWRQKIKKKLVNQNQIENKKIPEGERSQVNK